MFRVDYGLAPVPPRVYPPNVAASFGSGAFSYALRVLVVSCFLDPVLSTRVFLRSLVLQRLAY